MRILRALAMAFVLVPFAGQAGAQMSWDFSNLCSSGSLTHCASVIVKAEDTSSGGSLVTLWVRNEQGTNSLDNTGGFALTQVGIINPEILNPVAQSPYPDTHGNVQIVDGEEQGGPSKQKSPGDYWRFDDSNSIGGQVSFATDVKNLEGAIVGCNVPTASIGNYFRTCDDDLFAGWMLFSFTTSTTFTSTTQVDIAYGIRSVVADGESYQCRTSGEDHLCVPTSTIPEPISMTLLGTGLAGIAFVRRRRRSEDGGVFSDPESDC